jgi:hypothetical protein
LFDSAFLLITILKSREKGKRGSREKEKGSDTGITVAPDTSRLPWFLFSGTRLDVE